MNKKIKANFSEQKKMTFTRFGYISQISSE